MSGRGASAWVISSENAAASRVHRLDACDVLVGPDLINLSRTGS
jgi:hypothetical protein